MTKSKLFVIIAVSVVFLFVSSPVFAQLQTPTGGKIKLGPVEIHPSIGLMETYTDNIYVSYDDKAKESDYITTLSPGIQFLLPLKRHSFQVSYKADINRYSNNNETDYTNHLFDGALSLDFPGGLIFTLSDNYSIATIIRKWKEQAGVSGSGDPYRELDYKANNLNAKVRYNFVDRLAVAVWYNNYDFDYDESYDDSGSYNRNLGGGSIFYRFTAKTEALIEYNYSRVDYDTHNTNDNKNNMVYIGLSFDPTAKLNGYLKLGWVEKKYDKTVSGRDDSLDKFSSLVDLGYNISAYNQLRLKVYRAIEEDLDTNIPFTKNDVNMNFRHVLAWNERINLNANVGYGTFDFEKSATDTDYTSKIRDDEKWYGGVGVGYAIQKWLKFDLNYAYSDNDSNFKKYDYSENRVFLSALVYF